MLWHAISMQLISTVLISLVWMMNIDMNSYETLSCSQKEFCWQIKYKLSVYLFSSKCGVCIWSDQ